jgi:hypothetical protein
VFSLYKVTLDGQSFQRFFDLEAQKVGQPINWNKVPSELSQLYNEFSAIISLMETAGPSGEIEIRTYCSPMPIHLILSFPSTGAANEDRYAK